MSYWDWGYYKAKPRKQVKVITGAAAACGSALTMRTLPSASVISSSEIFDSETRSIKVFSLRKSMRVLRGRAALDGRIIHSTGANGRTY